MVQKKVGKAKEIKQTIVAPTFTAPIKWIIPDNLITRFATNMLVQSLEDKEFKISFFESKPPIILDPSAPPPQEIVAECVASIVITDERMPSFIQALQTQFQTHELAKKKIKQS
jgi:hypothetical protein